MNLTTRYLGLALENPLIASASPLNLDLSNIQRLEEAGAAAVVLPSIFEEQLEREMAEIERLTSIGAESSAETTSYFPSAATYRTGPHQYLDLIERARAAVDIPVIASLNGVTRSGWIDYARLVQEAGAHAIELNVYFVPGDPALSGSEVEQRYFDILRAVKAAVSIPVAVKLAPYFSSVGHTVQQLEREGADGFVLFNRFYQPDIDLGRLQLKRDLDLSTPLEIRLPLLWIAVLAGKTRASLAASTGVETADEVVKYLLAGADVVMSTSALLRHGIGHMKTLIDGLAAWLRARNVDSLSAIRGQMSQSKVSDTAAFERANYIQILQEWGADRGDR
ncbi:MAG TPA: dihydroorotate dehydrogenase-like protein [Burkholderiales bacterium]|nr:dihydroorotate dehydrogenase-like protein [Burkholderiales bacterium]